MHVPINPDKRKLYPKGGFRKGPPIAEAEGHLPSSRLHTSRVVAGDAMPGAHGSTSVLVEFLHIVHRNNVDP